MKKVLANMGNSKKIEGWDECVAFIPQPANSDKPRKYPSRQRGNLQNDPNTKKSLKFQ
jgi:hypothetical protein